MLASADKSGKCGDNVDYTYDSANKTLIISGTGAMYNYDIDSNSEMPPFPGGTQTIVIESGVTSIGLFAFSGMTQLTSVKIPSTISKISKYSFNGCISVNSISSDIKNPLSVSLGYGVFDDIPTDATLTVPIGTKSKYSSISDWNRFNIVEPEIASGKCGANVYYFYERTTYTLSISGNGAMWAIDDPTYYPWDLYRSEIQHVKISSGVTSIGDYAFSGCSGLLTATIPSSVSSIGMYAFKSCSKLETVTSEITNPSNIYDNDIFEGIPSDAKLIVPYGFKNWYESVDAWNNSFKNIVEQETKSGKCGEHVNYVFYSTDQSLHITGMGDMYVFDILGASSEYPPFPSSVQTIVIGSGVTSIGRFAFYGFTNLTSVIIPKSINDIQKMAFYNCSSLEYVLTEIEEPFAINTDVFDGIPSTATLLVPKGSKALYEATAGWNRFGNIVESVFEVDGISYKRSVDNSVSVVAGDEKYAGRIVIPSQVTFEGKTYNVTSVSNSAFKDCSELISLYLPEGLKSMGSMMFSGCTSLTCLNIPNSVTYIETGFTYGSSLDKVVIGSGIQKLVQLAIGQKLTTLAVLATTPPDFDVDQFTVDYIYVPKGCITAYNDVWSGIKTDILEIVKGDVNLDGVADEEDVDALVSYIMGQYPECFFVNLADLNDDNKVDVVDLVKLISIIKK